MEFVIYKQGTTPSIVNDPVTGLEVMQYEASAHDTQVAADKQFVVYKTFSIPVSWINILFDINGKFFASAYTR